MSKSNLSKKQKTFTHSFKSYKRAIRYTSIIIHFRIIFKKTDEKNVTDSYKFISLVCELKKVDLVLEAQINSNYENFPNMPAERKRPRSTLSFKDLNKFWRKKKKTEMTCTYTNKNPNIHNPLRSTTDPHNIYSAK